MNLIYYVIFPLMWCDLFLSVFFLNTFISDILELFSSLFDNFAWDLIKSRCFSIFQFTYCHLYVYIIWWFNTWCCGLYAHCPLFSTVAVCSILQFKVLLIIFKLHLQDFLSVADYVNFLISNQKCLWLNPFLMLNTSW